MAPVYIAHHLHQKEEKGAVTAATLKEDRLQPFQGRDDLGHKVTERTSGEKEKEGRRIITSFVTLRWATS